MMKVGSGVERNAGSRRGILTGDIFNTIESGGRNMKKKIKTVEEILEEKRHSKIPVDRMMPEVPEAPQPKVSIWNRIALTIHKKKEPIGNSLYAAGEVAGGFWGFILKVAGRIIAGTKKATEKAKEKTKTFWQKIIDFFKSLFGIK